MARAGRAAGPAPLGPSERSCCERRIERAGRQPRRRGARPWTTSGGASSATCTTACSSGWWRSACCSAGPAAADGRATGPTSCCARRTRSAGRRLAELREVAWRVYPAALDEARAARGAGGGRRARRRPGRGRLRARRPSRTPRSQTVAYFVVSEAVTNAAKHSRRRAGSPSRVDAGTATCVVRARSTDDGTGRRRPGRAAGCSGWPGRVAALDGRLAVAQPARRPHHHHRGAAVRVMLAEDSTLLREGLVRLLAEEGHEVVAAVGDAQRAAAPRSTRDPPDVVVVDVRMPPTHTDEGLRAALRDPRALARRSACWCCRSTSSAATPTELLTGDRRGRRLPAQGPGRAGRRVPRRAGPGRRGRRRLRPRGGAAAAGPQHATPTRCARLTPARARGARRRWPQGHTNAAIAAAAATSRRAPSRSTSTRSSTSSASPRTTGYSRRVLAVLRHLSTPAGSRSPVRAAPTAHAASNAPRAMRCSSAAVASRPGSDAGPAQVRGGVEQPEDRVHRGRAPAARPGPGRPRAPPPPTARRTAAGAGAPACGRCRAGGPAHGRAG